MIKKIISAIMIGGLFLFISCSRNYVSDQLEKEVDKNNSTSNEVVSSESQVSESNISELQSKSEEFLSKCKELEEYLNNSLAEKRAGTTIEMREAVAIEYKEWDSLLNEVYGVIIENLSQEEANALVEEENTWIETRDSKAKEAASEVAGGTMEPLVHESSLMESTKERCYELIDNYMK